METTTTTATIEKAIETKVNEIYSLVNSCGDIDARYHLEEEDLTSADDIREKLEDGDAFDIEIIYYSTAIEYLRENDPSLRISLELASDLGFEAKKLNSEILASLLASENVKDEFNGIESELDTLCQELAELREELEEAQEDEEETEEN